MKLRLIVSVFFVFGAFRLSAETFYGSFSKYDPSWSVVFAAKSGRDAYLLGGGALEIIDFFCDGKAVVPRINEGVADPSYLKFGRVVGTIFYVYDHKDIRVYRQHGGGICNISYIVGDSASEITVRYRINFPDGSISDENVLVMREISRSGGQARGARGVSP